jgi:pimeloyl-ACP methyl ester carboxylesterase
MSTTTLDTPPLTVVLVHGAFTDASSWNGVIQRLQAAGVQVTAPPNPLRGLSADSAYIGSFVEQVPGPVLVVGHSYTGAVISNAATDAKNVVGLVFVAAFATDEGETVGEVASTSKDAILFDGPRSVPLSGWRRPGDGRRAWGRCGEVPRSGRCRPSGRADRRDGSDAAPHCRARVLGAVRSARLEDPAVLGDRRDPRQGGRGGPRPLAR